MNSTETYDVIVVGAGVIGCSAAYHLLKAGLKTVLVEQAQFGAGASGANFGMVQSNDAEMLHSIPMVKTSYARYDHLEEELGMSIDFRRIESLRLLSTEEQWLASEERTRTLTAAGLPYEFIPPERVPEIEPLVNPTHLYGATYASYQAQCNPFMLMWAYLRRALKAGLVFRNRTRVTGFIVQGNRMVGVHTERGDIQAGAVILATAAWTRQLGQMLGYDWNIHTFRASAMVTEPLRAKVLRTILTTADHIEIPVTSRDDAELTVLALTQTGSGHFLIAQADRPGEVLDGAISHAAPMAMATMFQRYVPALSKLRLLRMWTSPTTYTDDGCPLLGPVKDMPGLILAASYRSAIVHAPLAGEVLTQVVTLGHCDLIDITPFAPERQMGSADTIYTVKSTYSAIQEQG